MSLHRRVTHILKPTDMNVMMTRATTVHQLLYNKARSRSHLTTIPEDELMTFLLDCKKGGEKKQEQATSKDRVAIIPQLILKKKKEKRANVTIP